MKPRVKKIVVVLVAALLLAASASAATGTWYYEGHSANGTLSVFPTNSNAILEYNGDSGSLTIVLYAGYVTVDGNTGSVLDTFFGSAPSTSGSIYYSRSSTVHAVGEYYINDSLFGTLTEDI